MKRRGRQDNVLKAFMWSMLWIIHDKELETKTDEYGSWTFIFFKYFGDKVHD